MWVFKNRFCRKTMLAMKVSIMVAKYRCKHASHAMQVIFASEDGRYDREEVPISSALLLRRSEAASASLMCLRCLE